MAEGDKKSLPKKLIIMAALVIIIIIVISTTLSGNDSGKVRIPSEYFEGITNIEYRYGDKSMRGGGFCYKDCSYCPNTKTCDLYGPLTCNDNAFNITVAPRMGRTYPQICVTCDEANLHGVTCKDGSPFECDKTKGYYFENDATNTYGINLGAGFGNNKTMGTCKKCPKEAKVCQDFEGPTECADGFHKYVRKDKIVCDGCPNSEKSCDDNGATECSTAKGTFITFDADLGKNVCKPCGKYATSCTENEDLNCTSFLPTFKDSN